MNLPAQSRPVDRKRMAYVHAQLAQLNFDCAACCMPKRGFGACFARCQLDGKACDGGIRNCSSC